MNYLFIWIIGFGMNTIAVQLCRRNALLYLPDPYAKLYDLGHSMLPIINLYIPDYLLAIYILISPFPFILGVPLLPLLEEMILKHGMLLIFRAIIAPSTVYPTCMQKQSNTMNYYESMFLSSHDLMFSGHTSLFVILSYPWYLLLDPFPS